MRVVEFASQLGIQTCLEFRSEILALEERIRAFCLENKCGTYGNNYMCPPYVGSLEEIRIRLKKFQLGVLLQYARSLDVRGDRKVVRQTKVDFHNKILGVEEFLRGTGINQVWGMIGGSCGLCHVCRAEVRNHNPGLRSIASRLVALHSPSSAVPFRVQGGASTVSGSEQGHTDLFPGHLS